MITLFDIDLLSPLGLQVRLRKHFPRACDNRGFYGLSYSFMTAMRIHMVNRQCSDMAPHSVVRMSKLLILKTHP